VKAKTGGKIKIRKDWREKVHFLGQLMPSLCCKANAITPAIFSFNVSYLRNFSRDMKSNIDVEPSRRGFDLKEPACLAEYSPTHDSSLPLLRRYSGMGESSQRPGSL
jgi:hypothetical protein